MEFIDYTPENCQKQKKPKLTVRITAAGMFQLSEEAVKLMELKPNDKIKLLQDKKDRKYWYIEKHDEGFPLTESRLNSLKVHNKILSNAMLDSLDIKEKSITLPIGNEVMEWEKRKLVAIITAAANKKTNHARN